MYVMFTVLLCAIATVEAENYSRLFYENFETRDNVEFWTSYGKSYKINFKGLSEERVFSGKRSFKLDVTFQQPGRYIWALPIKSKPIATHGMMLSGYMFIGKETNVSVALRVFYSFPPTRYSGYTGPGKSLNKTNGKWVKIEIGGTDIIDFERFGGSMCDLMLHNYSGLVRREEVANTIEKIGIDINAKHSGDRLVVYIDDVALIDKFDNTKNNRQNVDIKKVALPAIRRCEAKLEELDKRIREAQAFVGRYNWRKNERKMKKELEGLICQAKKQIDEIRARGIPIFDIWWLYDVSRKMERINYAIENMPKFRMAGNVSHIIYVVDSPLNGSKWILPFDVLIPGRMGKEIFLKAARGEYESASFVIHANKKLEDLKIRMSDLVNKEKNSKISADNVDIKVVKCWYQGSTAGRSIKQGKKGQRVLTPELLLNDDDLVKVDYKTKQNYIKLRLGGKPEYRLISSSKKISSYAPLASEFPIRDSKKLLPVSLSAGTNKQFWITVKVSKDIQSGRYEGRMGLYIGSDRLDVIKIIVEVLPFVLKPAYYTASIDYHGSLVEKSKATISSRNKSKEQMLAELRDMVAHGFSNCQHYFSVNDNSLRAILQLRRQAGMDNSVLYLKGHGLYLLHWRKKELEKIESRVRHIIEVAKEFGVKDVYFYGRDEVTGKTLLAERNSWSAVHRGGGKIFVAGGRDNLALVGDIQDMIVKAGWPDKKHVVGWHKYNHKIFSYANPQTGIENADVYRRNYGLVMWKYDYDGIADNAYQHTYGFIWNDFDHNSYRSHSMTYPTANGVIDTIAWEGFREGIDDVRYVTTLENMIEKIKQSEKKNRIHNSNIFIANVKDFIEELKHNYTIESVSLDKIRSEIIECIIKLN